MCVWRARACACVCRGRGFYVFLYIYSVYIYIYLWTHGRISIGTWSASAKLAVIFPGFSFVTELVLCNHQRFFLSRILLLGFGKLLSIKKKYRCHFVEMCVGFNTNCQNKSQSKSLPPDIHPLLFTRHDPHSSTSRYMYIPDFVHDETCFKARA